MLKLLEDEIPGDVTASHFGTPCANFVYGVDPRNERGYMLVEGDAGGWGAMPDADDQSALFTKKFGDTRNTLIEVLESQYPLRAEAFTLVQDSSGRTNTAAGSASDARTRRSITTPRSRRRSTGRNARRCGVSAAARKPAASTACTSTGPTATVSAGASLPT